MTIPRPGSSIWRRTDGWITGLMYQVSGASALDGFPGATADERLAAEDRQPGGIFIFDGNAPDDGSTSGGFEIEQYHIDSVLKDEAVVIAPSRPPFGIWEQLDEWPAD